MSAAASRLATLRQHLEVPTGPVDGLHAAPTAAATSFKYTVDLDVPVLTPEQRAFYEENGYIVFRKVVPVPELDMYRERFNALCDGDVPRAPMMTVMRDVALAKGGAKGAGDGTKGESNITKVQNFEEDPVLFSFCQNPDIVRIVTAFTGPDVKSIHTMLINKPPDLGTLSSRHPLHQDLWYFPLDKGSEDRIVCVWTAMQRITRENGCLVVIPGTHKGSLLDHGYPDWEGGVNKAYHGIKELGADPRRVHLEMDAGDSVLFHSRLIHGSGANRTSGFRKSISCHYASSHCKYMEVRGTPREMVADEIEDILKAKGVEGVTYQDVWRMKSRLVGGAEDTL